MKSRGQIVAMLILFALVLGYMVYNYMTGNTSLLILISAGAVIGLPAVNMIRALIESFK